MTFSSYMRPQPEPSVAVSTVPTKRRARSVPAKPMPLVDLFDRYRESNIRLRSEQTVKLYRHGFTLFRKALDGREPTLADLTDDTVVKAMRWIVDSGLSERTANAFRDRILALWRFAHAKRIVDDLPTVPAMQQMVREPVAWTPEELARLYQALAGVRGSYAGVPAARWWLTLHAVLWDSGERITALMQCRWQDVDLDGGWLRIRAEYRKGRTKDEVVKLHAETVAALREFVEPQRDLLWPWTGHPTALWIVYTRILKRAGLPHDREHKFHCMRRSVASFAEACGIDATRLLGHSSRAVTLRYLDPRITGKDHAADFLFRPGDADPDLTPRPHRRHLDPVPVATRAEPLDEDVANVPHAEDWLFRPGVYRFRGRWYALKANRWHCLRLLALSGRPVGTREVAQLLFAGLPPVEAMVKAGDVVQDVRDKLRQHLKLDASFNPVPMIDMADDGSAIYVLDLPPELGTDAPPPRFPVWGPDRGPEWFWPADGDVPTFRGVPVDCGSPMLAAMLRLITGRPEGASLDELTALVAEWTAPGGQGPRHKAKSATCRLRQAITRELGGDRRLSPLVTVRRGGRESRFRWICPHEMGRVEQSSRLEDGL